MGCQKKIAKQIIDKEADYVLALKDNHKTLHKEVEKSFNYYQGLNYTGKGYNIVQYEEADKVHVRVKTKKYTINDQIFWITDFNKWMSFKAIIMV